MNPKLERYSLTRVPAVASAASHTPGLQGKALVLSTGDYSLALASLPSEIGVFSDTQLQQLELRIVEAVRQAETAKFLRFGALRCSAHGGMRCVGQVYVLPDQAFIILDPLSGGLDPAMFSSQKRALSEAGEASDLLIGGLDWTRVTIPVC